ncbi:hypothetical protein LJ737_22860 [Hymenobacter sp. 15J16-1T3B]|uniref:hypothetical protein n=1 Tax=Hymenobacter sp. 15J16-1T3B TaxID=2886941 RepID=UPI001D10ECD1|nr:hypothetical protein [Hymenobacter sp. 15J16-1T3B]MCC3160094.1 hypothetical protein [Hymenobacter sp. 15J16-1T3B]
MERWGSPAFFGFQIGVQALANALFGLVYSLGKFENTAAGYWLCALLVLLIAPGFCRVAAVWVF